MKQSLIIAGKEFRDRLCSGWVIGCAAVWLGAIGLTSLFGLVQIGQIGVQGYERTVVSLLNLVQYLVPLLALLLGHDLVVSEREERTLALMLASGVKRGRVLAGKFMGGALVLAVPLVLGFTISGTAIRLATRDDTLGPFLRLAASGLVLGVVFLGLGLLVSTLCRTRVQALVMALLSWCAAVFVFDLVAMGFTVVTQSAQAAREIEAATDATHVNAVADIHAGYEKGDDAAARVQAQAPKALATWLLLNPVDLFRIINMPGGIVPPLPLLPALASVLLWLAGCLLAANWKLGRIDL